MTRAQAYAFTPAERLHMAMLFGMSRLSLMAAEALLLASGRLTAQARHRLLPEASA